MNHHEVNCIGLARHIRYFLNKPGHEFALVFQEGPPVAVVSMAFFGQLAHKDLVGLLHKSPLGGRCGLVPRIEYGGFDWVQEGEMTVEEHAEKMRAHCLELQAEAAKAVVDPLYALERALKEHDWYACMSDDYSVTLAGERHWEEIRSLKGKVGASAWDAMVEKYKPH